MEQCDQHVGRGAWIHGNTSPDVFLLVFGQDGENLHRRSRFYCNDGAGVRVLAFVDEHPQRFLRGSRRHGGNQSEIERIADAYPGIDIKIVPENILFTVDTETDVIVIEDSVLEENGRDGDRVALARVVLNILER